MNYAGKRVGIWGFGATGKSLLKFFTRQGASIELFDHRTLTDHEHLIIENAGARVYDCHDLTQFLHDNDFIVPSQGIDIRLYYGMAHYIAEVDLFAHYYTGRYIGVTGSCGKTTITTLLSRLLSTETLHVPACGNIGLPMLDIIEQSVDTAVVELSSFQLEHSMHIAPDLAIWTNLHPNHLDRHDNFDVYRYAKTNIIRYQKLGQRALIPLTERAQLPPELMQRPGYAFFSMQKPTADDYAHLRPDQSLYFMGGTAVVQYQAGQQRMVYTSPVFSQTTYPENWLIITAALDMLSISPTRIDATHGQLTLPDHRLVHLASRHGVEFYNDSKSTIPASTIAAVHQLQPKPIVLFLGGVSKGVDRQSFIKHLDGKVRFIICFGTEAQQLATWCHEANIPSSAHSTLDEAFTHCVSLMHQGDVILFSPAGASFDLFANYAERGNTFKILIEELFANKLKFC